MRNRWRLVCERGQTAVQYAGMAFFAALLVASLFVFVTPVREQITCKIQSAVATITGGSNSCGSAKSSDPYRADPSTVVKSSTERSASTGAGVSVPAGPGTVDVDGKDAKGVTSKTYMDGSGSRSLTSTQELSGGYALSAGGGNKSDGGAQLDAKVGGAAGLKFIRKEAEEYKCDTPGRQSCAEVDKNIKGAVEDHLNNHGAGRAFHGEEKVNVEADTKTVAYTAQLSLEGNASGDVAVGGQKDPATGGTTPGAKAGGSLKIGGEVGYTHADTTSKTDTGKKKTTSHEFTYKGELSASVSAGASGPNGAFGLEGEAEASGSYVGNYKVTYDENGKLQTITFTNVKEGSAAASGEAKAGDDDDSAKSGPDGKSSVTSTVETTLDVSTLSPEQRKIAEDYVNSSLTNGALTVPQSALNPNKPSSDPFDNLLYEKAQVKRIQQKGSRVTDSGGIDVWVAHWKESRSETKEDTIRAEQLGGPSGPGGERSYEDIKTP